MQLYQPMIDYTTITSFLPDTNRIIFNRMIEGSQVKEVSFSGYNGVRLATEFGSVAVVEGLNNAGGIMGQTSFKHYMAKFSGELSDASPEYFGKDCHITRLDIQITRDHPGRKWLMELESRLRFGPKFTKGRGRRINITLFKSDTVTIYGGSRTSDIFWRLYEKPSPDGDYLRWEFEVKGKQAEFYLGQIARGEATRGSVFRALVGDYDPHFADFVNAYLDCCGDGVSPKFVRTVERSTMDWLEGLTPTIERMLHSHQHGGRMRNLLERWQKISGNIDRLNGTGTIAVGNFAQLARPLTEA